MTADLSITRKSETSRRQGMGCLILFGLAFAIAPVFVLYLFTIRPAYQAYQARSWQQTPCQVISSSLSQHRSRKGVVTYGIKVEYSYEFGDQQYRGNLYGFANSQDGDRATKQQIVAGLKSGSTQQCWVNPKHPADSVLNREFTPQWIAIVFPLIFAAVGLLVIYAGFCSNLTTSGKPGAALPLGNQSLIPGPDGMVELKCNMAGTAIGLTIFSLFWNGFVWVFIAVVWSKKGLSTFPAIFLGIFALIGLLVLYAAIRSILRSMAPRPVIRVPAQVHLGGKFQLRWEFRRAPSNIQNMQLYLVGKESATYRHGKKTATDTSVFAQIPIIDIMSWAQIATGSAVVQVPPDTMHTFLAPDNRITWAIELREVIPNWPDVKCEYALTILPAGVKHG